MKKVKSVMILILCLLMFLTSSFSVFAYPAGSINAAQLSETQVKDLMATMLKDHVTYAQSIYTDRGDGTGYFGNGQSTEYGVRTNGDYALMYAFLYNRFTDATFAGVPRATIRDRSIAALKYAYSTHTVTGTINCTDGLKWGRSWQSSYWAAAFGLAVWLLHDIPGTITDTTYNNVETMLLDESNYSLTRAVPYQETNDTKAEENAWNTSILALTKGQFPSDPNASQWDTKMKSFAMNSYSTVQDEQDNTIVDGQTVATWVLGANIHRDYTLENHNIFHPWYETCPLTILTESALFYKKANLAIPGSVSHNVVNVWNNVIKEIFVADGEFAYPNGLDWAMYVYTVGLAASASMATYYQDVDAKFFESRLVQYQRARQVATGNGKFATDPAVDQERNAVIAHALVFSYLMHDYWGENSNSTTWDNFEAAHKTTKVFPFSNVIRGINNSAYTAFSWKDYFMGTLMPRSEGYLDNPYVTFPYKKGNTGNITGYFQVIGKAYNAVYQRSTFNEKDNCYATAGYITENDASLDHYIAFAQTPGNAVVYLDKVLAKGSITVKDEGGISTGILTDPICGNSRTLYYQGGSTVSDGNTPVTIPGNWANVDRRLGLVMGGTYALYFGGRELLNSVYVSRLFGTFNISPRNYTAGQVVTTRNATFYSNIDEATTAALAADAQYPTCALGWKNSAVKDPDNRRFYVAANLYCSTPSTTMTLSYPEGAPVFEKDTTITGSSGSTVVYGVLGTAQIQEMGAYVSASTGSLTAVQGDTPYKAYIKNPGASAVTATVKIWNNGSFLTGTQSIAAGESYLAQISGGAVTFSAAAYRVNYAFGATASASSTYPGYSTANVNDGDTNTGLRPECSWANANGSALPQWVQLDFGASKTFNRVELYSSTGYAVKDYQIQYWNGSSWIDAVTPVTGNTQVHRTHTFSAVTASKVRLLGNMGPDAQPQYIRINEIEVYND